MTEKHGSSSNSLRHCIFSVKRRGRSRAGMRPCARQYVMQIGAMARSHVPAAPARGRHGWR
jgi:hypothetical protein